MNQEHPHSVQEPIAQQQCPGNISILYILYFFLSHNKFLSSFDNDFFFLFLPLKHYKSDLTNIIKWDFFPAVAMSVLLYGYSICTLTKSFGEKDAIYCFEQILEAASHKAAAVWLPASYL